MKTKNLIITLGAVAFAAITININASDALLSPRATGNQITKVSSVNTDPNLLAASQGILLAPRVAGNQITKFAGTYNEVNPATACAKSMNGTPKAIQACVEHTTMPGCNPAAVASVN